MHTCTLSKWRVADLRRGRVDGRCSRVTEACGIRCFFHRKFASLYDASSGVDTVLTFVPGHGVASVEIAASRRYVATEAERNRRRGETGLFGHVSILKVIYTFEEILKG